MLRVRFPNGQAINYNDATKLEYRADYGSWELKNRSGGWIASVPAGAALVEAVSPCTVENPLTGKSENDALRMVAEMLSDHRHPNGGSEYVALIKQAVASFDLRSWTWRT